MLDNEKIGRQIALLRKEKGLTGEQLAELLDVSAQAVSKWENGKCLPETSLLPKLAEKLGCSIDALLLPKELLVLSAVYSDGMTHIDVTQILNNLISSNKLNIVVNSQFLGTSIQSGRMKVLTVKFQNPCGVYYIFAAQNEALTLDTITKAFDVYTTFKIVGAFYGNADDYSSALQKIRHYEYYKWDEICANHENFPSSTATDDTEYLTLVYVNSRGIFAISCEEGECINYNSDRTALLLKDNASCFLPDVMMLGWGKNMDCTWAGAVYAALKHLGENVTYEQIMGLSGACYRIAFTDVWDWSTVDALTCFDYSDILFRAIGFEQIWADRVDKPDRISERRKIVDDIRNGKPVIAINLRIAPEWGVVTGFLENGKRLLCRTYFDDIIFDERKEDKDFLLESGGYLETDWWPFMIVHFGERLKKQTPEESLKASLKAMTDSFYAPQNRGYYQGREAYGEWIRGLKDEAAWMDRQKGECDFRHMSVNDYMLLNLADARRCAGFYLEECAALVDEASQKQLLEIARTYAAMAQKLNNYRNKVQDISDKEIQYNAIKCKGVSTLELRQEQIKLLEELAELEAENVKKAELLISNMTKCC